MADQGGDVPQWQSRMAWKMPEWIEPVAIVSILLLAMFITRRKDFSILQRSGDGYAPLINHSGGSDSPRWSSDSESRSRSASPSAEHHAKTRRVFGYFTVQTPNSSRFARHIHSRILQKYPFLVEMFYWALTYFFYRMTAFLSAKWYGGNEQLWDVSQEHGLALLELEASVLSPRDATGTSRWIESRVQQWFLAGAEIGDWRGVWLTVLNRCYALIHIPGTVGFIAYYYATAPTHTRFCVVRRTMSLLNLFAFFIFTVYPCMPPRLLPPEYGFIDTVNAEKAASVWMSGNYVNKLAAMPSMHFGYAFAIGCVFIYESGVLRGLFSKKGQKLTSPNDLEDGYPKYDTDDTPERSGFARAIFFFVGIFYPAWILLTIVATANHYIMDALAATLVVLIAFLCNKVLLNFLVLEDWLLWAWRLEKPEPTTGLKQ